jgi:DNA-binding MurR/RpiR family transcriptional regulator
VSAPGSYQELAELLRDRLPNLTGGQLRIAHLLLADPEGTAFRGIAQAAKLTEVHESSVARFANSLGLPGYPAVMELCRVWLAERAHLARRSEDDHEAPGGLLAAVLEQEQTNLSRTFRRLEAASWSRAVALLAEAPRVHVIGLRDCAVVADLLCRRLGRVRTGVHRPAEPVADQVRQFAAGDALFAVSVRRYAAETVRAVAYARDHGLSVITLTDHPASPLADRAEAALFAETGGVGASRSLTACLSVAQALAAEVSLRFGDPGPDDLPPEFGFFHET